MKKWFRFIIIGCIVAFFSLGPIACEKKGPAEKAGEKIDEAVDSVKDTVKKATD